jgi:uncharacterized membrane protein
MRTTGFVIAGFLLVLLGVSFASMLVVLNDHGILMNRGYTSGMSDSMMGDMMDYDSSSMMGRMPNGTMYGTASGMMGSMMSGTTVTNTTGMMNSMPSGMMRGYASMMGRMMVRSTMPMLGLSAMRFMLWPGLVLIVAGGGLLAWLAFARQAQSVPAATQSVLDILNLRYAKGEINKEQFEEMRQSIKP